MIEGSVPPPLFRVIGSVDLNISLVTHTHLLKCYKMLSTMLTMREINKCKTLKSCTLEFVEMPNYHICIEYK